MPPDCLHRGVLPLWNPHVLLGVPFLAEPQTALFYPPNWLYHFLPLETAWGLNFALRQLMAAVFTAMCARSFGASPAGATVAAIVFALCGWVTAFQGRPQLDTMLWLPLIVFAVDRLHRQQSVQSLALTMLAFALPVLAGHVECALHATVFGAAFAIFRMLWPATLSLQDTKSFHRKRFLLLFVAAGAGAVMLAAVQILPTLEWLGQLQRSLRDYWGSRPTHEVLAFFSRDIAHNPNAANIAIPEGAGYVGMMTLLLVPFAFFGKNRREAVFLAVAGVVAIQIVYGLTPGVWIARHTPLLCGIPNWRLLSVVGFAFAVLSGFGLSALEDTEKDKVGSTIGRRWWISYGITSITTTIGMAFLVLRMATSGRSASHWYDGVGGSALFLLASIVVIGLVLARRLRGPNLRRFALVLLTLDLVTFSYSYVPFVPKDLVFPPAPLFSILRKKRNRFQGCILKCNIRLKFRNWIWNIFRWRIGHLSPES